MTETKPLWTMPVHNHPAQTKPKFVDVKPIDFYGPLPVTGDRFAVTYHAETDKIRAMTLTEYTQWIEDCVVQFVGGVRAQHNTVLDRTTCEITVTNWPDNQTRIEIEMNEEN